jgi:hypothetical protein
MILLISPSKIRGINTYDDTVNIPQSEDVLIPVVLMRDIYSIIVCIDTPDLTERYLQYYRMY